MKAREIMTKAVVSVGAGATVAEIAELMSKHHISGVPVVSKEGALIGIVSQSDLLFRAETGSERKRGWWRRFLSDPDAMAREYAKSHGQKAADVMSRFAVSVSSDADLGEVASTLDTHGVRRVPVVDGGNLVGIITRSDCIRALAGAKAAQTTSKLSGVAQQKAILEKMRGQAWLNSSYVNVQATNGGVELSGFVSSQEQRQALRVLAEEVCGNGNVRDRMVVGMPFVSEF